MQNQPSKRSEADFKKIFTARPGHVIVCADFSQIEVRVFAEISGDEEMKSVYRRGEDIYRVSAANVLGKKAAEVTEEERQAQKAVILGRLFGLGAAKFGHYAKVNYDLDFTLTQSEAFIDGFKETFPTATKWQYTQGKLCEESLEAKTVLGKIRALPSDKFYGAALNTPIQGTAAEIILFSLCKFFEKKEQSFLLLATVHDEILVEVPEEKAAEAQSLLVECMIEGYLQIFPNGIVTKLVEAKFGKTWSEAK